MLATNFIVTIVVPCFNEAENIPLIVLELKKHLKNYNYEIILVDDGSTDHSKVIYKALAESYSELNFICFSRNFGHQAALLAGINEAKGDVIITIDADLQQPPKVIPKLIKKWQEGFWIVEAIPIHTNSISSFKKYSSYIYYWLLNWLSEYPIVKSANDFRLIDREVAEVIKQLCENHLYLRGLYAWMGFKKGFVEYDHLKRKHGKTHYPFFKMIRLAINGITALSTKPLRIALLMGLIVSFFAFVIMCWALYLQFFTDKTLQGWASTIISTVFLAGVQLIVLGIIGEYLGKLFMENKRRPNYIIKSQNISKN